MYNMSHKIATGAGLIAALFAGPLTSTHAQTLSELALLALIEAGDVDIQGQCKKALSENLPNFVDINVKDKQ